MTVVVDASVAAKWFLNERGSVEAEDVQRKDEPVAPDLVVAEVLNTIWKNVRLKRIVPAQLDAVAGVLPGYFASLVPLHVLSPRAARIAVELDHPIYDCIYLALAERESCLLITADDRLIRKTRRTALAKLVKPLL